MSHSNLTFLVALHLEAVALRKALAESGLAICVIPIGLRASRIEHLPKPAAGSIVIVAGLGGGLDPSLQVGNVVFDGPSSIVVPANVRRGPIFTSSDLVTTAAQKAELYRSMAAAAVDMEQSIVAAWCSSGGTRVYGLRAISDAASDSLNPLLLTLVDDLGRPRPAKIATAILRRPLLLIELIQLGRRSKRALRSLSAAAVALAQQQWPDAD